jgi:hypothetical protein
LRPSPEGCILHHASLCRASFFLLSNEIQFEGSSSHKS